MKFEGLTEGDNGYILGFGPAGADADTLSTAVDERFGRIDSEDPNVGPVICERFLIGADCAPKINVFRGISGVFVDLGCENANSKLCEVYGTPMKEVGVELADIANRIESS